MRNTKREIECLQRLHELTPIFNDLLEFLKRAELISKEELKAIRLAPNQAKELQAYLALLSSSKKIQLLEYEWSILPVERIRVTIVTDSEHQEFSIEV